MAVNKVVYDGNTLIDLTSSTVTPGALALGVTAKNAKGETITGTVPVMGTVADNVITLTGELANGNYTVVFGDASATLGVWVYTNQIPISTDTDGTIYNGTGYKLKSRVNSSGAIVDNTSGTNPTFVTGFIPCKQGDIIRLKNCFMLGSADGSPDAIYGSGLWGLRSGVYNSSKTKIDVFSWGFFVDGNTSVVSNYTVGTDDKVTQFTIAKANTAYVRLTLAADIDNGYTAADAIVTVNEEID